MNYPQSITRLLFLLPIIALSCSESNQKVSCNLSRGIDYFSASEGYSYEFYYNLENAISCSKQSGKLLLLIFRGITCNSNRGIDLEVLKDSRVKNIIQNNFIPVILYVDDSRLIGGKDSVYFEKATLHKGSTVGDANISIQMKYFDSNVQPLFVVANTNLEQIGSRIGFMRLKDKDRFIEELEKRIR